MILLKASCIVGCQRLYLMESQDAFDGRVAYYRTHEKVAFLDNWIRIKEATRYLSEARKERLICKGNHIEFSHKKARK